MAHGGGGVFVLSPNACKVLYMKKPPLCGVVCYGFVTGLLRECYEPLTHFLLRGWAVLEGDHFTLSAQ